MEIKTIKTHDPALFDMLVNKYLKDGWNIHSLSTGGTNSVAVLVAFLTKNN